MDNSLLGLDPSKGMFRRYEIPVQVLSTMSPIFADDLLMGLVSEIERRLRQLDRFYEEAWANVHRAIATKPTAEQIQANPRSVEEYSVAMNMASDAAEAFYLFGFRVLDVTRELKKRTSATLSCKEPKDFNHVRNHLIVHPESYPGKVLSWSVYVTNKDNRGVVLKKIRNGQEKIGHDDPGIGPNAEGLREYLEYWIMGMHSDLAKRVSTRPEAH
jgi:hypothetical protein